MPNVAGPKLYVAAVFATAFAMRVTIGDSPLTDEQALYVGWALNGICSGLGMILGPEVIDGVKNIVFKLANKE